MTVAKSHTDVSVVCAAYNAESTLARSLASVLQQKTSAAFEVILIDDGSNDNTFEIAKELQSHHRNFRVITNRINVGLTRSLNIGIAAAKGEYIARHDADDYSYSNRIEDQLAFARRHHLDFCASRFTVDAKRTSRPHYHREKLVLNTLKHGNFLAHGTFFIRRDFLDRIGRYDEDFRYAQDMELALRVLKSTDRSKIIQSPLYHLTRSNDSVSSRFNREQLECYKRALQLHGLKYRPSRLGLLLQNLIP